MPDTTAAGAHTWKAFFDAWPETLPQRGVVVNSLNEAMPFKGFMIQPDVLLLERQNPDTLGARFILLRYPDIAAVKLIDPLTADAFRPMGFEGRLSVG